MLHETLARTMMSLPNRQCHPDGLECLCTSHRRTEYGGLVIDKQAVMSTMTEVKSQCLLEKLEQLRKRAEKSHHSQTACILFRIPAELRNQIFELALEEYEDMSRAYCRETYYCRPGFQAPRRIDVALLRTCKRVWLETRVLPIRSLESNGMAFAFGKPDRCPPESFPAPCSFPPPSSFPYHSLYQVYKVQLTLI